MGVGGTNGRSRRASGKSPPKSRTGAGRKKKPAASKSGSGRNSRIEHLEFAIPSNFEQGREVQQRVLDAVQRHGFSGQPFFAIKLALEEALVNAIKHGNRLDPKKQVRVEVEISPDRFRIGIEDEGPGFDRGGVPDPTSEENLEKCSGRGILLMESYMTRVAWDHGGRRVTLTLVKKE
jgi:serine/threonine-protein kinase RsbW